MEVWTVHLLILSVQITVYVEISFSDVIFSGF